MKYDRSIGSRVFDVFNVFIMLIVIFVTLYPYWYSVIASFNHGNDYLRGGVNFWPRVFTLANYTVVFQDRTILSAYAVTIARTIVGTFAHVIFTSLFSYGFSHKKLMGKSFYAVYGLVTMFFSGGLIPTYILFKNLGLLDNFLVYIIPPMFHFWHVIIFQAFFREIPDSINESAKIDGANEYTIYFRLIVPLSKPVIAAITLFTAVFHWNSFFDSMVFTSSRQLQTIQLYLTRIILTRSAATHLASRAAEMIADQSAVNSRTIQAATMVVTSLPIIMIYPFLQKHFVKGLMLGAVKG